jgi:small conductance mechanosensitive channel
MAEWKPMLNPLLVWLPSAGTALVCLLVLLVLHRVFERRTVATSGRRFSIQLLMALLTLAGVVLVVLTLPVGDAMRGQILSLMGIVISAAIALSSATLVGNAMAGIMMRAIRAFRIGDFIQVGDHFGRVTEWGLFHTEIQTENRDLTTLPNLFLVSHPVTTVRTSGTIVSACASLGYDVSRHAIEERLLAAAVECGLKDPYVQILDLGDFSVTYRVAGLLEDVKTLLTARSRLRGAVMDALHGAGIEIVSPNFMNQRVLDPDRVVVPTGWRARAGSGSTVEAERLAFDKAEEAESLEALRGRYREIGVEIEKLRAEIKPLDQTSDERAALELRAESLQKRRDRLAEYIAEREAAGAKE